MAFNIFVDDPARPLLFEAQLKSMINDKSGVSGYAGGYEGARF
jgi:hypothetical protein